MQLNCELYNNYSAKYKYFFSARLQDVNDAYIKVRNILIISCTSASSVLLKDAAEGVSVAEMLKFFLFSIADSTIPSSQFHRLNFKP